MNIPTFRFAPSPTGYAHLGSLRTALVNYLAAKSVKGKFLLRIDDTDIDREVKGSVKDIFESLKWVGIIPDSVPIFQSKRLNIYNYYIEKLISNGFAYKCFASTDELLQLRQRASQIKPPISVSYDRRGFYLSKDEINNLIINKKPFVVRLKTPDIFPKFFDTVLKKEINIQPQGHAQNGLYDDIVIMRSNGIPTYHLASVVDDHLMGVTNILRGEDWISATPKHIYLAQCLGFQIPQFGHLPLIFGEGSSNGKLSKRKNDISISSYRNGGILPEALVNYVALLGWNIPNREKGKSISEVMSLSTLEKIFSLNDLSSDRPHIDHDKLDFLNKSHLQILINQNSSNVKNEKSNERYENLLVALKFFLQNPSKDKHCTYGDSFPLELVEDILKISVNELKLKNLNELGSLLMPIFHHELEDLNNSQISQDSADYIKSLSQAQTKIIIKYLTEIVSLCSQKFSKTNEKLFNTSQEIPHQAVTAIDKERPRIKKNNLPKLKPDEWRALRYALLDSQHGLSIVMALKLLTPQMVTMRIIRSILLLYKFHFQAKNVGLKDLLLEHNYNNPDIIKVREVYLKLSNLNGNKYYSHNGNTKNLSSGCLETKRSFTQWSFNCLKKNGENNIKQQMRRKFLSNVNNNNYYLSSRQYNQGFYQYGTKKRVDEDEKERRKLARARRRRSKPFKLRDDIIVKRPARAIDDAGIPVSVIMYYRKYFGKRSSEIWNVLYKEKAYAVNLPYSIELIERIYAVKRCKDLSAKRVESTKFGIRAQYLERLFSYGARGRIMDIRKFLSRCVRFRIHAPILGKRFWITDSEIVRRMLLDYFAYLIIKDRGYREEYIRYRNDNIVKKGWIPNNDDIPSLVKLSTHVKSFSGKYMQMKEEEGEPQGMDEV